MKPNRKENQIKEKERKKKKGKKGKKEREKKRVTKVPAHGSLISMQSYQEPRL
jgi:hypothetical protein